LLAVLIAAGLALALVLIRLAVIFPWRPGDLDVGQEPVPADAVVVLEGAPSRIAAAVELLDAGYADTLIYPGISPWSSRRLEQLTAERQTSFSLLTPESSDTESTYEEARNTRRILAEHPSITSILLVTSSYHTFRTRWTFSLVLPKDITIIPVSVPASYWSPTRAQEPGGPRDLFRKEQRKFLGYFFLYGIPNLSRDLLDEDRGE
jgi:uncharacterized SAM-binding protein YcdF (DUF218 family)